MQRDLRDQLFRPELVKRIVIYSLLTLILGSAQCSFFPALSICPATPDLVMGMLLAVLLIDSEKSAAPLAIGAGFFLDAMHGSGRWQYARGGARVWRDISRACLDGDLLSAALRDSKALHRTYADTRKIQLLSVT